MIQSKMRTMSDAQVYVTEINEFKLERSDWSTPCAFESSRHKPECASVDIDIEAWRLITKMKTVTVGLVLCLNIGVDPPDVVKTHPSARLEGWIDPFTMSSPKAVEAIAENLQKQYESWQPRARYKCCLDPTLEDVKKLCTSLRRHAKEDRVLFHYNGHGVPKPTSNGEIWVFNRSFTQYIPLSIYDLQSWLGSPSVYIYDCSNAGMIVESFKTFADQHEREYIQQVNQLKKDTPNEKANIIIPSFKNCIQLGACATNQTLPMSPNMPADLFTSCLTSPIRMSAVWFTRQNYSLNSGITLDMIERIPGKIGERHTMFGELNWIFIAITDTIAWNSFSKEIFIRLYRQDMLVASMFRNFLLAQRIMRTYDCTPVSSPELTSTHKHPLWVCWDYALDMALRQLPDVAYGRRGFQTLGFFEEQLIAFELWLQSSSGKEDTSPPVHLPIVLQVLLSTTLRARALELLARFLDFGPWAVNLTLSVGIYPYIIKLLQSKATELRPVLVFIWAKIFSVDTVRSLANYTIDTPTQIEMVRDKGYLYFMSILQDVNSPDIETIHRTQAAFLLACVVRSNPMGQKESLKSGLVNILLEHLTEPSWRLRQWIVLCLATLWENFAEARWLGVRDRAADKLFVVLEDPAPEVRAAAIYALGTFISSATERSEHANTIDQQIIMTLLTRCGDDMSWLVRRELIVGPLQCMIRLFEPAFVTVASWDENKPELAGYEIINPKLSASPGSSCESLKRVTSRDRLRGSPCASSMKTVEYASAAVPSALKRVASSSSLSTISSVHSSFAGSINNLSSSSTSILNAPSLSYGSVYMKIWQALSVYDNDPHPQVAQAAGVITAHIRHQVKESMFNREVPDSRGSMSLPPSPNRSSYLSEESPPTVHSASEFLGHRINKSTPNARPRKLILGPSTITEEASIASNETCGTRVGDGSITSQINCSLTTTKLPVVQSDYFAWSARYFTRPVFSARDGDNPLDRFSDTHLRKMKNFRRNEIVRREGKEERRRVSMGTARLESQVFTVKNPHAPSILRFNPYEPQIAVVGKDAFSIYDVNTNAKLCYWQTRGSRVPMTTTKITSLEYLNAHDVSLILIAHDDGAVKVWRPFSKGSASVHCREPTLVTAWQCLPDNHLNKSTFNVGTLTKWEQDSLSLLVTGDTRYIRIWDVETERKVRDIPTVCDYTVTSLDSDEQNLIVAGFTDGSVRLYDRRVSSLNSSMMNCSMTGSFSNDSSLVCTWREHISRILNVTFRDRHIVSGSIKGDIRTFNIGEATSHCTYSMNQGISSMAVHPTADTYACCLFNPPIVNVQRLSCAETMNVIKFYEGFMSSRIGPINCLAYHSSRVELAIGSMDCCVNIYSLEPRR